MGQNVEEEEALSTEITKKGCGISLLEIIPHLFLSNWINSHHGLNMTRNGHSVFSESCWSYNLMAFGELGLSILTE